MKVSAELTLFLITPLYPGLNMLAAGKQTRRNSMAMTLLELILVMIVLCTVLAMAAPSLRGFFATREINESASKICSLMNYASTKSISESNFYRFNYNSEDKRYWLSYLYEGRYEILETEYSKMFYLSSDIDVDIQDWDRAEGSYYVEFSPLGRKSFGRMRLKNPQGNMIDILCLSATEPYQAIEYDENSEEIMYEPFKD